MAPFSSGETPLQHYNSLFCLHQLQTQVDGVILFQNDHILTQALKSISAASKPGLVASQLGKPVGAVASSSSDGYSGDSGVSVEDMNRHMSNTLCNVLLPVWSAKQKLVSFRSLSVRILCIRYPLLCQTCIASVPGLPCLSARN